MGDEDNRPWIDKWVGGLRMMIRRAHATVSPSRTWQDHQRGLSCESRQLITPGPINYEVFRRTGRDEPSVADQ